MSLEDQTPIRTGWVPVLDTFPNRLREVRRSYGMNQQEFADHVGLSNSNISDWEAGRTAPRDEAGVVRQIAAKTGVDMFWLMFGDTPQQVGEDTAPPPNLGEKPSLRCFASSKATALPRVNTRSKTADTPCLAAHR